MAALSTNEADYKAARSAIAANKKKKKSTSTPGSANAAEYRLGVAPASGTGSTGAPSSSGSSNPFDFSVPSGGSYASFLSSAGNAPSQSFSDYLSEANKIYKPQLDYLAQQTKDANTRAGQYDTDLAKMYATLVGNIDAQQGVIDSNYNNAINTQGQITSAGKASIGNNYSNSQAQQMAMLKRLGIEAAAPQTLQTGQDGQAFFQSLLDQSGAGYNSFLNSQKVAAKDFNTAQSNIAAQTGTNARADLKMSLQDILAQFAGRGADLQTQINQQASTMQQSAVQQMLDQQKAAMAAQQAQDDYNLNLAKFKLDQQKAASSDENAKAKLELGLANLQNGKQANDPNVWNSALNMATGLYTTQVGAVDAIKAIQNAIRIAQVKTAPGRNPSKSDVMKELMSKSRPDAGQLQAIVDYVYKQMN